MVQQQRQKQGSDVPVDVPTQRAKQKAETRRRLLEAASQVLMERGVADASMEEIAERAGVSKATLFFHFGNRMDLLARVGGYLYLLVFPSEGTEEPRTDLGTFLSEYLANQSRPEVRLLWELGDLIARTHPDRLDAAYWHLVGEIELRMLDTGLGPSTAHDRSQVLTPALMLVAQRAARDLTTAEELRSFVEAAVRVAMCPPPD
jgi:AcrR family transcriptional regulator